MCVTFPCTQYAPVWYSAIRKHITSVACTGKPVGGGRGAAMQRFRCSPVHGQHGTNTNYWCHKLNMPHYRGLRDVALNVR